MEENPLHSRDLLYGVPRLFRDILEELEEGLMEEDDGNTSFDGLSEDNDVEFERRSDEDEPKLTKQRSMHLR